MNDVDIAEWDRRRQETPSLRDATLFSSPTAARGPGLPAKRIPRFLGDDLDDDATGVDDLFRDLDDIDDSPRRDRDGTTAPPPADGQISKATFDPLARTAEGEEGDGPAPKKKRIRVKLDEKRLLGETGFPVLRKELKRFKLRGKGRERDDLKRLLSLYQLWAHSMFPSVSFRDAVETIEKVCHKRVMQSELKQWRLEASGRAKPKETEAKEEEDDDDPATVTPFGALQPSRTQDDGDDEGEAMLAAALASTQQPVEEDEFEVDEDMLREAEQAMPRSTAPSRDEFDDDEAMLREMEGEFSAPPVVPAKKRLELEEDGFDDAAMLEELERVEAKSSSRAPTSEAPIDEDLAGFFDEQMDEDIYA